MSKKIILISCISAGAISTVAITTVAVLIPIKNNLENAKNLRISPKSGINNIFQTDIAIMTSTTNNPLDRAFALSKLFNGITESNVIHFVVEETSNSTITLIAQGDHFFNSEDTKILNSIFRIVEILNILPIQGIVNITQIEFDKIFSTSTTAAEKVVLLSKLFEGVTENNIANFSIETSDKIITLTASDGFAFAPQSLSSISVEFRISGILNITAKPGTINISSLDLSDILSTTSSPAQKTVALSKVFDGVTEADIQKFTIERTSSSIILKANEGYSFGTPDIKLITTNINVVQVLNIKVKTVIGNVTDEDVQAMISNTNSLAQRIAALSKIFDGINESNINNFTVTKTSNNSIVLEAKFGYAFGPSLANSLKGDINSVSEILNITAKPGTTNITNEDILDMITISNIQNRITALSKIFDGINPNNVNHIRAEKTSEVTITLIANEGYFLGSANNKSIKANIKIVTILNISPKPEIINVTPSEINAMISTANQIKDRIDALSKVFDGVNNQNIANIKATKTSDTEITLNTINDTFIFLQNSGTSIKAGIKIITLLKITPKPLTVEVSQNDIDNMSSSDNHLKLNALRLLFDGLNAQNVVNVTAEHLFDEIILRANDGYAFEVTTITSIKTKIKLITLLPNIKPKTSIANITQADINEMISSSNTGNKVAALSKLFDGINNDNIHYFVPEKTGNTEITLRANDGYAFGSITQKSIKTTFTLITILNIKPKPGINDINLEIWGQITNSTNTVAEKVLGLSYLFEGIDLSNYNNLEVTWTDSSKEITLTTKEGFVFDSTNITVIKSTYRLINILNITPKGGTIDITEEDYNKLFDVSTVIFEKLNILNTLFNNIDVNNFSNFRIEKGSPIEVNLRANPGYAFVNLGNTLITTEVRIIRPFTYNNDEIHYDLNDKFKKNKY
ncbi:MAG: hypothetical protein ACRCRP_00470 [Metamycoplasmataceae bacterium]